MNNKQSDVINMTSEELRKYLDAHKTHEYVLVDVRQTEEYEAGHIPGAQLMPLGELEAHIDELRQFSGRDLVFYCRSGGRSARACAWASQIQGLPSVHNLLGGFSGWEGPALTDFPPLASFDLSGSVESLLRRAMDLEKGTHRLYERIVEDHPSGIVGETISALVSAELAHGAAVHKLLNGILGNPGEDFEAVFAKLPGNIIENGISFDVVLERAKELGKGGSAALLELALEIELGAYDLYKNLAAAVFDEQARHALDELAQQEKVHSDLVLRAIGRFARAQNASAA